PAQLIGPDDAQGLLRAVGHAGRAALDPDAAVALAGDEGILQHRALTGLLRQPQLLDPLAIPVVRHHLHGAEGAGQHAGLAAHAGLLIHVDDAVPLRDRPDRAGVRAGGILAVPALDRHG